MARDRQRLTSRVAAALAGAAVAVLMSVTPAAAQPPTLEEIYQRLGVDRSGAEYVVLIDTSASMRTGNLYDAVRASLREFFAALAPDDSATLVAMAGTAQQIWSGKVGRNPDEIVSRMPALPDGAHTDLGAGISAAVGILEQRAAVPVAGVIMLTDGQHDPPPGSPFPLAGGYAWQELAERATKLPQRISAFGVQLRGVSGADQLRRVFPSAQVLDSSAVDQLTTRLAEPKAAVRAAAARRLLEPDASAQVSVAWPGDFRLRAGANRVRLTLSSSARHLPLQVTDLRVSSSDPSIRVDVPAEPLTIEPGGSAPVVLTVRWDAGGRSWQPLHEARRAVEVTLSATAGTEWAQPLSRDLGLTVAPTLTATPATLTGSAQRGSWPAWLVAAVLLLVLMAAGAWLRWLRLHPVPGGTLLATRTTSADRPAGSMPLQRRRAGISAARLGIPGSGTVSGRREGARARPLLEISYSPDGTAERTVTGQCPEGGAVDLQDVRFEWRR
jgi:hypothetical protein